VSAEFLTQWADQAFMLGLGLTLLMLLAEGWWPRVRAQSALGRRWLANLVAYLATILTLRWLPALSMIGAALLAERQGWGLLNRLAVWPAVTVAVSIVAIDLAGYLIHRLEHHSPLLWRIHRLHHSDPDVDVTTTYRFHPFEVVLRAGVSAVVVLGVGVPVIAAALYQLISTLTSVLSHADVKLPHTLDAAFGWIVITPDIHRTHHSIDRDDSNSNFSVCLSCWDRLFGTFRSAPKRGHENMIFGTESRTAADGTSLLRMLADPFLPERAPEAFAAVGSPDSVDPHS
jgi:sterol desaturase/sphingolipid hydroxylase (fatty acid hydroxylase superfamily)